MDGYDTLLVQIFLDALTGCQSRDAQGFRVVVVVVVVVLVDSSETSASFFTGASAIHLSNTQPTLQHSSQSVKKVLIHDGVLPSTVAHIPLLGIE